MPKKNDDVENATAAGFNAGFKAYKPGTGSTPIADQNYKKPSLGDSSGLGQNQGYQPGMIGSSTGQDPASQAGAMQRKYNLMGGQ